MSVSISSYSQKTPQANCMKVELDHNTLWFSYQTVVAFRSAEGLFVRQNEWGPTTGKHLNWIDGGNVENRLSGESFEKMLADMIA